MTHILLCSNATLVLQNIVPYILLEYYMVDYLTLYHVLL